MRCLAVRAVRDRQSTVSECFSGRPNRDGISAETACPGVAQVRSGAGVEYRVSQWLLSFCPAVRSTTSARAAAMRWIAIDRATRKVLEPQRAAIRNDRGDGPRSTPTLARRPAVWLGCRATCLPHSANVKKIGDHVVQKWRRHPLGTANRHCLGDRIILNAGGRRASIVRVEDRRLDVVPAQRGAGYSSPV